LAAGRPVIFAGSPDSAIAGWIREYGVGWVLTPDSLDAVAAELRMLSEEPGGLTDLQRRCHAVYQEHFSWRHVTEQWAREVRALLPGRRSARAAADTRP